MPIARLQGIQTRAREGERLVGVENTTIPGVEHVTPRLELGVLRELMRNLQAFESLHEVEGIDVLISPDGQEWCLWDIQYLYSCRTLLSPRQQQAIELCLYSNVKEREAARMMGIGESSPVAVYANNGLKRLIAMAEAGQLPKFRMDMREAV